MPAKRYRRDQSEVSCCLKYVIFGFNVIFWLLGLSILAIGVWAWTEKDTFKNLSRLTNIALDPAFVLIITGLITFTIGFTGCVGALRENTCLLACYAIFLAILLLLEMTAGILGFIFKDWIKAQATNGFQAFIVHYRDDPDQQNLIDWIQEKWLHCCGIQGPNDWDRNIYFNCSSEAVGSREACGVPFSCCKPKPDEIIKNNQCGYDVRKQDYPGDRSLVIYDRGCLRAGEEWIESNLVPVAGVAVGVAILQFAVGDQDENGSTIHYRNDPDFGNMLRSESSSRHICTEGQVELTVSPCSCMSVNSGAIKLHTKLKDCTVF